MRIELDGAPLGVVRASYPTTQISAEVASLTWWMVVSIGGNPGTLLR